jgi:hypothetical protein
MEEETKSVTIASFPKNNRELICVGTSEYQGKQLIFVRAFTATLSAEPIPTPAGVSLAREHCTELLQSVRALKDILNTEGVAAKIKKNATNEVWVGANIYKEKPLIYIRTYSVWGDSSEMKPTKKGVSINAELYPQLLDAIEKLAAEVSKA